MQVDIVSGIYTDDSLDIRTAYPKNLVPSVSTNNISNSYLRPADGLVKFVDTPGFDRGGINWNNELYRVCGNQLCKIDADGTITQLGDVGGTREQVTFTYSFDRLAIASNNNLFYYDPVNGFAQVTDLDLGTVLDVVWIDGYFMTTDGEFLVVTDIDDPTSINPLKYGSSEAAPDPIKALQKLRNEVYALNRYTIEVFDNVGGTGFPFERIESALIERGTIGTHTCCTFMETIAFLGSGKDEAPAIWLASNSVAIKLSTREIDIELARFTEDQLAEVLLESKIEKDYQFLYIHLADKTLVYDANASKSLGSPIWHILSSSLTGYGRYRARNIVYCYDKYYFGDTFLDEIGYFDDTISSHYGDVIEWEFSTPIIWNETNGMIIHELELTTLPGRVALGVNPTIFTDFSTDGVTWSNKRGVKAGAEGLRNKQIVWLQQGYARKGRIQRFRGTSDAFITVVRLDLRIEPLYV
jgi:hypothetical protein